MQSSYIYVNSESQLPWFAHFYLVKWLVVIDFTGFSDVFEADLAKKNKQKQRTAMQGASRSQKAVHKAKRRRLSSSSSGWNAVSGCHGSD